MKTLIIAEAGVNHNGDIFVAKDMIDAAAACGADVVKFQTAKIDSLVTKRAKKAEYQKRTTNKDETQFQMLKKLILPFEQFIELSDHCAKKNIAFSSTAFDLESVAFLHSLVMPFWKIPSGEITNLPLLIKIAEYAQPIVLSTGMATIKEINAALQVLRSHGAKDMTLLHCTTEYPTPFADVNLKAMNTLEREFHVPVGYSDHTNGIEVPIAAAALGATIIEKHFTLDRNMEGPDHKASLEPKELKAMVDAIRNIEIALGNGIKKPAESEIKNMAIARKSIVAKKNIVKGETLTEENLAVKRPGEGVSPMHWYEVIGTVAKRDFEEDELIEL